VLLTVIALAGLALPPPHPVPAAEDSLDAIRRVGFLLRQRYDRDPWWGWAGRSGRRTDELGRRFEWICDADRDDVCFADDPDAGKCPNLVQCHPTPNRLVEVLVESAKAYPASGWLTGQAVYVLGKLDFLPEAMDVADGCRAEGWWCDALRVYVLHAQGEDEAADSLLHLTLAAAPDSIACAWDDATWTLGSWSQRGARMSLPDAREGTDGWDCRRRIAVSDTIWWLADPLYSVPGNDRRVEHFARSMSARFFEEIRRSMAGSPGPDRYHQHLWAGRVRRGPVDSYDSQMGVTWTSRYAARYHFVPDVGPESISRPTWRLEAELDDEGYTPPFGPFLPVPYQLARFRVGDSLRVAVATRLDDTPLAGAVDGQAAFILTDGPDSMPVRMAAEAREPRTRFLAQAPDRRYVAGLEVVTTKGVGWARQVVEPLRAAGPEISDLLLYRPEEPERPGDNRAATAAMRGSTTVARGAPLGVYWETYGAPTGATLRIDLSIERDSGGLVDRLRGLLPGGGEEGRGRITWTEEASADMHSSSIAVDPGNLGDGAYTLVLRVGWEGRTPLERRREFRVESD